MTLKIYSEMVSVDQDSFKNIPSTTKQLGLSFIKYMRAKKWSIFIVLLGCLPCTIRGYAPNYFIGTCLTPEWVAETERKLEIDSKKRDRYGRLEHPFLRPASTIQYRLVEDDRQSLAGIFSGQCLRDHIGFYGPNAQVDEGDKIISQDDIRGTLVVEIQAWTTHTVTAMIYSILAQEILGYKVSILKTSIQPKMAERMSTEKAGTCTPTHINLESWDANRRNLYAIHHADVARLGSIGYNGRAGLYTTADFVRLALDETAFDSGPYSVDFWRDYKMEDAIIDAVSMSKFNNTAFYPTSEVYCKDGTMGCLDNCARTYACTLREERGDECIVVQLMVDSYDPGYFQAVLDNLDVAAYMCFIGHEGVQLYANYAKENKIPILFYHFEPDIFHAQHKGDFQRVLLPLTRPERVVLDTNTFGENGYGQRTNNKVDVDFPSMTLSKYMSRVLKNTEAGALAQAISISEFHVSDIMERYFNETNSGNSSDPYFTVACGWVRDNYKSWKAWLSRPDICTFEKHVKYTITGCGNSSNERVITFEWKDPDSVNPSLPASCDGGLLSLPDPIRTSRTCDWLEPRYNIWTGWIKQLDYCDQSYYSYTVSDCDNNAYRYVTYHWLLPNKSDPSKPIDCEVKDITLPDDVVIHCEYVPTSFLGYTAVLILCALFNALLILLLTVVYIRREAPIIKRSQYQLLMTMIMGGIMMVSATAVYAGKPTKALCLMRPTLICFGFTTVFGALIVKSLRVYRVFMKSSMKKQIVSTWNAFMKLFGLYFIDTIILSVWFAVDPPVPTIHEVESAEFAGYVDVNKCSSENGIFSIMLMFWKAVMLFMGLYASFLIRHVSADFQEAIWIFASSVVVLLGCLVILPLAYMVKMPATNLFTFLSGSIFLCTALVMGLMLAPKFMRLKELSYTSRLTGGTAALKASEPTQNMHDLTKTNE